MSETESEEEAWIRRFWKRISKGAWPGLQLLLGLALIVLAFFVLFKDLETGRALVGLAIIFSIALLAAIRPQDVRDLVERLIEAGPLKFSAKEAQEAVDQSVGTEDDSGTEETLVGLRIKLEYKLAYIAKHLLGEVGEEKISGAANFVNIGSLKHDGLLTREQARTATHIMTWTDDDLRRTDRREAADLMAAANELIAGIRASVFAQMVSQALEADGWKVRAAEKLRTRRDWLATRKGEVRRVVPVFATEQPSGVLSGVLGRLEKRPSPEEWLVVIPDRSDTETSEDPPVVRLAGLLKAMPDAY